MKWRSLKKPDELVTETASRTFGRFVLEPLETGFGTTIGNAMRRVLLSSMQGVAVSGFRIEGVLHEFTTIPDVVEDVTEIIMNLKGIRFRVQGDLPKMLYIDITRKGEVLASDIQGDSLVEIVNPTHHIATLAKERRFQMELEINQGKGYALPEENQHSDAPVGMIFIDSIFTPVRKVNYIVESARVGQRIDYDKLILDLETDGTITPQEALTMSAHILMDHFDYFLFPGIEIERLEEVTVDEDLVRMKNLLRVPVSELELSVRASNCLKLAGIDIMADLVSKTEQDMLRFRNFGKKSLEELTRVLEDMNLSFGVNIFEYFTPDELEKARKDIEQFLQKQAEEENVRPPKTRRKRRRTRHPLTKPFAITDEDVESAEAGAAPAPTPHSESPEKKKIAAELAREEDKPAEEIKTIEEKPESAGKKAAKAKPKKTAVKKKAKKSAAKKPAAKTASTAEEKSIVKDKKPAKTDTKPKKTKTTAKKKAAPKKTAAKKAKKTSDAPS